MSRGENHTLKAHSRAIVMDIGSFRPSDDPMASWFGRVSYCLPAESWPFQEGQPMHASDFRCVQKYTKIHNTHI